MLRRQFRSPLTVHHLGETFFLIGKQGNIFLKTIEKPTSRFRICKGIRDPMATTNRPDSPDRETLVHMYEIQSKIKTTDERFRSMLTSGQIQLIYYSPRGQECISAGYAVHLRPDDYVVTIYRGLHDHLAKGVPMRELWA